MLEPPNVSEVHLIAALHGYYGLSLARLDFLPLGADQNTAVYRAEAVAGTAYFVKLRGGVFNETVVILPKFLSEHGLAHILPPLTTKAGELWARLAPFTLTLYPFLEGQDGYAVDLSDEHWRAMGATLKQLHSVPLPAALRHHLPQETISSHWRVGVSDLLARVDQLPLSDELAAELVAFLKAKQRDLITVVERAEQLAHTLSAYSPELVLCHADLHAGNALIDRAGALYLVDWDTARYAPKERDLMFIGGGLWGNRRAAEAEVALFYQGYGPTEINPAALAYYRYDRILEDIVLYCEQILFSTEGGEDRAQALHYLKSNFLPNHTIALAQWADLYGASR